jgi:hypothetical protein
MGVTIRAFSSYEKIPENDDPDHEADDERRLINHTEFADRCTALPIIERKKSYVIYGRIKITDKKSRLIGFGSWRSFGESRSFSYGGYNNYRDRLVDAFLGADKKEFDGNEPFFEQICFADNEGCMDGKVCAKLVNDYKNNRDKFIAFLTKEGISASAGFLEAYDDLAKVFAHASPNGIVIFT